MEVEFGVEIEMNRLFMIVFMFGSGIFFGQMINHESEFLAKPQLGGGVVSAEHAIHLVKVYGQPPVEPTIANKLRSSVVNFFRKTYLGAKIYYNLLVDNDGMS